MARFGGRPSSARLLAASFVVPAVALLVLVPGLPGGRSAGSPLRPHAAAAGHVVPLSRPLLAQGGANATNDRRWATVATAAGSIPSDGAVVYDPYYGGMIEFGGYEPIFGDTTTSTNATFLFANGTWTNLCPPPHLFRCNGNPPARDRDLMVYDQQDQEVLLVGGRASAYAPEFTDTWALRNSTWVELSNASWLPGFSSTAPGAQLIDDPTNGIVLMAYLDPFTDEEDTFEFIDGTWTVPDPWPGAYDPFFFYDPAVGGILGVSLGSASLTNWPTYELYGPAWSLLSNTAGPDLGDVSAVATTGAAFDSVTESEVLPLGLTFGPPGVCPGRRSTGP